MDSRKECPTLRRANKAWIAEFIEEILPPIRLAARGLGYAITVHGSLSRDIDLVAIPWTESAHEPELLIQHIRGIIAGIAGRCCVTPNSPTEKPHGRKAYTFIHMGEAEIDLSVMPLAKKGGG